MTDKELFSLLGIYPVKVSFEDLQDGMVLIGRRSWYHIEYKNILHRVSVVRQGINGVESIEVDSEYAEPIFDSARFNERYYTTITRSELLRIIDYSTFYILSATEDIHGLRNFIGEDTEADRR